MASVAPASPARLGLAFRAKYTKELARSGLVEPEVSRPLLHGLVPIAANNQGAVLALPPRAGPPERLMP